MTKNVTIRMDEALLRQVRHRAVDENLSTSKWIMKVLREATQDDRRDAAARRRSLKRLDKGFHLGGTPLSREQTHVR